MNAVDVALYNKLTGDAGAGGVNTLCTGGIYNSQAEQGASGVYLVFQDISDVDSYTLTQTSHIELRYQFSVYEQGESYANTGAVDARLKALLNDGTLTLSGYTLKYMRRIGGRKRFDELSGQLTAVNFSEYYIWVE